MSINLTVLPLEWRDTKINLLDTPGYADFVGEMMAGLRVADAALLVVSAEKGVEVGTQLAWEHADEHALPRLIFINKLDRDNTSYDSALESLRGRFGGKVDCVIYGHSHIPKIERVDGTLFFNPGSAEQRRWHPHFGVGLIRIANGRIEPELILWERAADLERIAPD